MPFTPMPVASLRIDPLLDLIADFLKKEQEAAVMAQPLQSCLHLSVCRILSPEIAVDAQLADCIAFPEPHHLNVVDISREGSLSRRR